MHMIKDDNRDLEELDEEGIPTEDDAKDLAAEEAPTEEAPAEESAEPPAKQPKLYGRGTAIAGFIFFAITACVFAFYEYFAITFLYMPFANGINDIGEAIAAIFGYTFGLAITLAFGVAQLPENIISIILFNRIRRRATTKGKRITYTVFFALSIVMLLVMLLTIGGFFAIIGANN